MSVAHGTPSSSAASAGASVRMSATATSGLQLPHERPRVERGVHDGLIEVQRLGSGRKHLVLGRGRRRHALGLDVLAPARPRLQRDVVPARDERASERDHREGVAGVAKGAQQHPQRPSGGVWHDRAGQAASSASMRS